MAFAFEVFTNYHLDNAKLFFLLKAFLNFAEQMEPLILGSDFLVVYLPPHLPHQQSWLVLGNKGGLDYRKPQSCDSHLSRWYLLSLFCSASGQLGGQGWLGGWCMRVGSSRRYRQHAFASLAGFLGGICFCQLSSPFPLRCLPFPSAGWWAAPLSLLMVESSSQAGFPLGPPFPVQEPGPQPFIPAQNPADLCPMEVQEPGLACWLTHQSWELGSVMYPLEPVS